MTNAWRTLCNKDIWGTLRLLGCDPKYINGGASDFECFREWCVACTILSGNVTAESFAEKLSDLIGEKMGVSDVAAADAAALWQRCNIKLNGDIFGERYCVENHNKKNNYNTEFLCDEKINNIDSAISLNILLKNSGQDFNDLCKQLVNESENQFFVTLSNDAFCRPDRYHAEQEYKKHINGEKCNINLIITQLICEIIYLKKCEKIQLIVDANYNLYQAKGLIEYLVLRQLNARVFLLISHDAIPKCIVDVCAAGNESVFVTPCVLKNCASDLINELSHIYPRGAISVIDHMEK